VVDLVPSACPVAADGTEDPITTEGGHHGCKIRFLDIRVAREVGQTVRDLRSRGRHEMPKNRSGDVLLLRRQSVERAFEMLAHDLFRAAEPA
jgi:hypothetical protein